MKHTLATISLFFLMALIGCEKRNGIDDTPKVGNGFSVSTTSQVVFAKGNLQYQANTKTYRFADSQYAVCGQNNAFIAADNAEWIDLFGWGTGKNPIDTTGNSDAYTKFNDWGNFIGADKEWRTLSYDEWNYLISKRTDAMDKVGAATVDTVCGFILLPDGLSSDSLTHVYANETTTHNISFTPNAPKWNVNVYDVAEWHILDSLGVAFLPITGYRVKSNVYFSNDTDNYGYYWTSTPNNDYFGWYVLLNTNGTVLFDYRNRSYGHAVRLVKYL